MAPSDSVQAPARAPSVAVVGASSDRRKYGNRALRAYLRQGWTVYPVNPSEPSVEGLPTFARVEDIPEALDRVTLYVPPHIGRGLLAGIKAKGPREFFVNPGAEDEHLMAEAASLGLEPIYACSIIDIGERP